MNLKRVSFLAIACLFFSSICFAELWIWLNNGNSIRAFKIVFQGETADVYLLDGSVRKIPVSQIDLKSSGIGKPEGTYGGQGPGPTRLPNVTPPIPVDQKARQDQLKDEWERSERTAIAINNVGPIRSGDTVRIVAQTEEPPTSPYFVQPEKKDDAFVILYKSPDGTYGKKLFDAATFAGNFQVHKKPEPVVSIPLEPRIPGDTHPSTQEPAQQPPPPVITKPATKIETKLPAPKPAETQPAQIPGNGVTRFLIAVLALAAIAVVVILLSRKRKKPFVDSSKFRLYEEELREFEIEIWLKHGKTEDQLVDICAKKFYGDQPGPMTVLTKMQRGVDHQALVTFICKQAAVDPGAAEKIYLDIKQKLDWIRSTIQSVTRRTGVSVLSDAPPTGIMPAPKPASKPAAPPPAAAAPPIASTGIMPIPKQEPASAPVPASSPLPPANQQPKPPQGVPQYLSNVMKNLALLSSPPE